MAVSTLKPRTIGFTTNMSDLRSSLAVAIDVSSRDIEIPESYFQKRINRSKTDKRVEELTIKVPFSSGELTDFAKIYARAGKSKSLKAYLELQLASSGAETSSDGTKRVLIDERGLKLMSLHKFSELFSRPNLDLKIDAEQFENNPSLKTQFLSQLREFINKKRYKGIERSIADERTLSMNKDLLPDFATKMLGRYTLFRGPNCFHAALAFHGADFAKSPYINVKPEDGYHDVMINYDELWRVLESRFYEVDPMVSPLKYGDMIVFYDLGDVSPTKPAFRALRHAATYLLGNYTFSKGSKSADTPYTIKTIEEEWDTWTKFTSKLGVKIFRRNAASTLQKPLVDLTDWIY